LRHFGVARDHGGGGARVEHGPFGHLDRQWRQTPLIQRDVFTHQRTKHIEHNGARNRQGRIEITLLLWRGSGEIDDGGAGAAIDRDGHLDLRTAVHWIGEGAVREAINHGAHRGFCIVLDMLHIGGDSGRAVARHHPHQGAFSGLIGGNLRLKIGDVLVNITSRVAASGQDCAQMRLLEHTAFEQARALDHDAFIFEAATVGRHRAGGPPTDIGMMPARTEPKRGFTVQKHRRNHSDIGQMRAATIGRVEHEGVALRHIRVEPHDGLDAVGHRPQMHRNMRCIGDQMALRVKDGAREIEALFDVHRPCGVGQGRTHLIRHGHEQIRHDFEQNRIGVCAHGSHAHGGGVAGQNEIAKPIQPRRPAGFDEIGSGWF